MTTEEEALLAEIVEHPEDDVPRLVYADWLEERGDPRGEFVRVQCERAALEPVPENLERDEWLEEREQDLLLAHEAEWTAWLGTIAVRWVFRRGFVEYVELSAAHFVEHAARLLSTSPLQLVTLHDARGRGQALAGLAAMSRITGLCLDGNGLESSDLEALAGSPHLGNLMRFSLSRNHVRESGVEALAGASFPRLEVLDLSWNEFGNAGAKAIAESTAFPRLTTLLLSHNTIRLRGSRALARSETLPELRYVDVTRNPIDQRGIDALRERFGEGLVC